MGEFNYADYIGLFGCLVIIATVLLVELIKKVFIKDSKVVVLCPYIAGGISCLIYAIYGYLYKIPFLPLFGRALLCACIAIVLYDSIIKLFKSIPWKKIGQKIKDWVNKTIHNLIKHK